MTKQITTELFFPLNTISINEFELAKEWLLESLVTAGGAADLVLRLVCEFSMIVGTETRCPTQRRWTGTTEFGSDLLNNGLFCYKCNHPIPRRINTLTNQS